MKDLAVAISLYNKVDELKTTVKMIREYWDDLNDSFISVCCNDPSSIEDVRKIEGIDVVTLGKDLPVTPKPYLRSRQFDCISTSTMKTFGQARHTLHVHADAYAIDSSSLLTIINEMKENDKLVAFRGRGLDYRSGKCIYGDVDDHFMFFNTQEIEARQLFDCDPLDHLSMCNVESLLAYLIQRKFKKDEVLFYSDMRNNLVDDSKLAPDSYYPDNVQHRAAHPFNIDEKRKFIHSSELDHVIAYFRKNEVPEQFFASLLSDVPELVQDEYVTDWLTS